MLVFFHGGGFFGGSGNDLLSYDGENLARRHDVVVVTHNHRLNVFGFLNLAGMGGERYRYSANVSMLDNLAVLQWVRDNIAQFGGDPERVLAFGQSGGGGKVGHLMGMPAAKGLFHRAGIMSGSVLEAGPAEESAKLTAAVLTRLGIGKANLEKLHTLPTSAFAAAAAAGGRNWAPTIDGAVIPGHPFAPTAKLAIPLLVGTCLNEFINGVDNEEATRVTWADLAAREPADRVAALRREFPRETPFGIRAALAAAEVRHRAQTQAERQGRIAPVWQYVYAWRTPALEGRPGTFHSSDIAFTFDNADLLPRYSGLTPEALALSRRMAAAWAGFAQTGTLPWAPYTPEKRLAMIWDSPTRVQPAPAA